MKKIYFFPHKPEFKIGYYKMWSVGNFEGNTKYCFNVFGLSIIFILKGIR